MIIGKNLKNPDPPIRWNKIRQLFTDSMKSEATMKAARSVLEKLDSNDTTCIDKAVQELNDIYTLKGIWNENYKKESKQEETKKWYDYSCFEMSKRLKLVGKMVEKDPKNP